MKAMSIAGSRGPKAGGAGRFAQAARGAFTLIEMLVVIGIIAILAGLIVGLTSSAGAKKVESRVRTELNQLVGAIETYHKKNGFYPPDHAKGAATAPWTTDQLTPLYYELTGTEPPTSPDTVFAALGVAGIANSGTNSQNLHHNLKPSGFASAPPPLPSGTVLLVVPYKGPNGDFNPWHYNSSSPEHNTETYDLWAEVVINGKTEIIGNWKD